MTAYTHTVGNFITTGQIVGANESLLVTRDGRISTVADDAIFAADNTTLDIFGTVISASGFGLYAEGSSRIWVGATGSVSGTTGLLLTGTGSKVVQNDGRISGVNIGIDAVGALTLVNKGIIEGGTFENGTSIKGSNVADIVINEGAIRGGVVALQAGSDTYYGRNGLAQTLILLGDDSDRAYGGAGADYFGGESGDDLLDGGSGQDMALFLANFTGNRTIDLRISGPQDTGEGTDTLISIENVMVLHGSNQLIGNNAGNLLAGGEGADTLIGGIGNDTLFGGSGDDVFNGGSGFDVATFIVPAPFSFLFPPTVGAVVNLGSQAAQNTGYGSDAFIGIEGLIGTSLADRFTGNSAANTLWGQGGNDTLDGGTGRDVISGGPGNDTFVFRDRPGSTRYDKITDYNKSYDSFQLDNKYMAKLGPAGRLSSSKFVVGPHAKDANDHLIYDRSTGKLYYDADGSGGGAQVLIAHFTNKAALTYAEFTII